MDRRASVGARRAKVNSALTGGLNAGARAVAASGKQQAASTSCFQLAAFRSQLHDH
jgi:hypothetical protein